MLELKAPPVWNGPNTGSLAPGVRKRVKKIEREREKLQWRLPKTIFGCYKSQFITKPDGRQKNV